MTEKSIATATPLYGLYSPNQAARFLSKSESWLAKSRMTGDGPRYTKIGASVRYDVRDLVEYIDKLKLPNTSQDEFHLARMEG